MGKPIRISNIRQTRKRPGLRPQHFTGIKFIKDLCQGHFDDENQVAAESSDLSFTPGPSFVRQERHQVEVGTAGSLGLLMQAALPCLLFSPISTTTTFVGGTDVPLAPSVEYCGQVFAHHLHRMGARFNIEQLRRGFYPAGGGRARLSCEPMQQPLAPITLLDRGELTQFTVSSFVSGSIPRSVAERMCRKAESEIRSWLLKRLIRKVAIKKDIVEENYDTAVGDGTGILIVADTNSGCRFGSSGLGAKGKPAEQVATECVATLLRNLEGDGCVDEFTQDQLIIYMALATGTSKIRTSAPLTLHTQTAIHFTSLLTGAHYRAQQQPQPPQPQQAHSASGSIILECDGIGFNGKVIT